MAKYSTGGASDRGGGGSCELCGKAAENLRQAQVAGAELEVCQDCAPHDERDRSQSSGGDRERKRRAAQNAARLSDSWDGDSTHWEEEGTNYDDDPLPYLVSDYGDRLREARQDAGLQRDELAAELDVPESVVLAVEQGRANQASVGGSVVEALEERLDVELAED